MTKSFKEMMLAQQKEKAANVANATNTSTSNKFMLAPKKQEPKKQEPKSTQSKRSALFGTGFTKKLNQKLETQHKKTLADLINQQKAAAQELIQPSFKLGINKTQHGENVLAIEKLLPSEYKGSGQDIILDASQQAALKGMLQEKFSVLIGPAGCGKTTVIKQFLEIIKNQIDIIDIDMARIESNKLGKEDLQLALCCVGFTGRSVQQIKRALPVEYHPVCNTIHSTLGFVPSWEPMQEKESGEWKEVMRFRPTFTASNKLPYQLCIIDEGGMVSLDLWEQLLAALRSDCRIVIIGDINQLPPVHGKSILGFAMINWPTFELNKIHRQAENNPIIANAHRVLEGKFPITDNQYFIHKTLDDGSRTASKQLYSGVIQLHKIGIFDEFRDAIIVPQNKTNLGQIELNERFVTYFNPTQKDQHGVITNPRTLIKTGKGTIALAVGDKVMLLENSAKLGLTNGMLGRVSAINRNGLFKDSDYSKMFDTLTSDAFDIEAMLKNVTGQEIDKQTAEEEKEKNERQASHSTEVTFLVEYMDTTTNPDGSITTSRKAKEVTTSFSTAGDYKNLAHAYAFTCHKSQGGEYHCVVIGMHSANSKLLCREWLYTAITRGQERVIIFANNRALAKALKTQRIKGVTIEEKAKEFLALQESLPDEKVPYLPKPKKIGVQNA